MRQNQLNRVNAVLLRQWRGQEATVRTACRLRLVGGAWLRTGGVLCGHGSTLPPARSRSVAAQMSQAELGCLPDDAGGNIAVSLGVGLRKSVLSDTHARLCECVEQKTKTSQIFEIIGHLI